jgi:hypothetical protein
LGTSRSAFEAGRKAISRIPGWKIIEMKALKGLAQSSLEFEELIGEAHLPETQSATWIRISQPPIWWFWRLLWVMSKPRMVLMHHEERPVPVFPGNSRTDRAGRSRFESEF